MLARVCVVDYVSGIAVYDKLVKPESPITDYLTRSVPIFAQQFPCLISLFIWYNTQVVRYNPRGTFPCHDYFHRSSIAYPQTPFLPPDAHPARPFAWIGFEDSEDLSPSVYRHGTNLSSSKRQTYETGFGLADEKMVRKRDSEPRRGWAWSWRGCSSLHWSSEEESR